MLTALIVAAGSSQRMGFDKLFADLAGKPVVGWSVAAFQACDAVDDILLVTRPEREPEFRALALTEGWTKLRTILPGGAQRHLSVWNGLQAIASAAADEPDEPDKSDDYSTNKTHFVAVHDGARPLVTPRIIKRGFDLATATGAACCASPVSDTLKRADGDRRVTASVDRTDLWAMQTPQTFSFPVLFDAYRRVIADGVPVTDETSALEHVAHPVSLFDGGDFNLKITFPPDLELARHLLAVRPRI